jgi:hypothetical protein
MTSTALPVLMAAYAPEVMTSGSVCVLAVA